MSSSLSNQPTRRKATDFIKSNVVEHSLASERKKRTKGKLPSEVDRLRIPKRMVEFSTGEVLWPDSSKAGNGEEVTMEELLSLYRAERRTEQQKKTNDKYSSMK